METAIQCSCKRCIPSSTFGEKAFRSCPSHRTPVGKTKLFPIMKDEARSLILIGVIILIDMAVLIVLMAVDRTRSLYRSIRSMQSALLNMNMKHERWKKSSG
jgi:hypothetical protein